MILLCIITVTFSYHSYNQDSYSQYSVAAILEEIGLDVWIDPFTYDMVTTNSASDLIASFSVNGTDVKKDITFYDVRVKVLMLMDAKAWGENATIYINDLCSHFSAHNFTVNKETFIC